MSKQRTHVSNCKILLNRLPFQGVLCVPSLIPRKPSRQPVVTGVVPHVLFLVNFFVTSSYCFQNSPKCHAAVLRAHAFICTCHPDIIHPVCLQMDVSPSTIWKGAWREGSYNEASPFEDSRLTMVMKPGRFLDPSSVRSCFSGP